MTIRLDQIEALAKIAVNHKLYVNTGNPHDCYHLVNPALILTWVKETRRLREALDAIACKGTETHTMEFKLHPCCRARQALKGDFTEREKKDLHDSEKCL